MQQQLEQWTRHHVLKPIVLSFGRDASNEYQRLTPAGREELSTPAHLMSLARMYCIATEPQSNLISR